MSPTLWAIDGFFNGVQPERNPNSIGQPGTVGSMLPVYGPARSTIDNVQNGQYGWAIANFGLTVSDLIPARATATAIWRGTVWKFGDTTWDAWNAGVRTGVKPWLIDRGWREYVGQHFHHWLIPQGGWGSAVSTWIKNQPWNILPMPSRAIHNAVEGKGPLRWGPLKRFWHGTPHWFKGCLTSGAGRTIPQHDRPGDR